MSVLRRLARSIIPGKILEARRRFWRLDDQWVHNSFKEEFFWKAFKALSFNGIDGDYAEFGCHRGMTFALAYREASRRPPKRKLWAFDSFRGLPRTEAPEDSHPKYKPGTMVTSVEQFHKICRRNKIPDNAYQVIEGFYEGTLAKMSPADSPTNLSLAYIDCDFYSSTKSVLGFLAPRLKHGMILAFDDYYCWSPTRVAGERLALQEYLDTEGRWNFLPYIQYGWGCMSFVVEDRSLLHARSVVDLHRS